MAIPNTHIWTTFTEGELQHPRLRLSKMFEINMNIVSEIQIVLDFTAGKIIHDLVSVILIRCGSCTWICHGFSHLGISKA